MHAPRPRAVRFSLSLSPSLSPSFSLLPIHFSSFHAVSLLSPVYRWFPRIAFRGQFNRSCAVGCAKWSCVLGDKWDTSFLSIEHLPADEFIRSRVHNPAEPADRIRGGRRSPATGLRTHDIYVYTRGRGLGVALSRWRSCRAARELP